MQITIYSKNNCVYCTKAKNLVKNLGLDYTEKKLEEFVNREQNNSLSPGERRHSAYNGIPREPLFNINMDSRIWSPDAMDPFAN